MTALNFPTNPSLNDTYTFGTKTWIWNGAAWQIQTQGAINNTPIGNITPSTGAFTTVSATGNISGGNIIGNGSSLSGINTFSNIAVAGETTVSADSISDTLTLVEGSGISIVTDAANNTITFGSTATNNIFVTGGNMGTVVEEVTTAQNLGLIVDAVSVSYDLGFVATMGPIYPSQLVLPTYTVSTLPSAVPAAQMIFVSNESGGAVPAFSDGTNWRRVTDRTIVS